MCQKQTLEYQRFYAANTEKNIVYIISPKVAVTSLTMNKQRIDTILYRFRVQKGNIGCDSLCSVEIPMISKVIQK
jgi:hypothetical protein